MKTQTSSPYTPPFVNTGEFPAISRRPEHEEHGQTWTYQERQWWKELMARSRERNAHFEVEAEPGLGLE